MAKTTKVSKDTAATPAKKPAIKPAKKPVKKPAAKKTPARKPAAKKPVKAAATAAPQTVAKEPKAAPVAEASKAPQAGKTEAPTGADAKAKPVAAKPAPADEKPAPTRAEPAPLAHSPEPAAAKSGLIPMILGGAAAAAIGFGAAMYLQSKPTDIPAKIEQSLNQQDAALKALKDDVAALSGGSDLSGLEAALAENGAAIAGLADRLSSIEGQIGALNARLIKLEDLPTASGPSEAAYAEDLAALRTALAAQKIQLETLSTTVAEQDKIANADARATLRRAALTRVLTALDNGLGFAPALADLEETGVVIPASLTAVANSGVASLAELQERFPDAARAALAAARAASPETGAGGFTAFLRDQFGARSLEPQAGNDPDAILSRVEAASRDDRLNDALAELEALPEVARIELSDWAGDVARRLAAQAAAEQLGGKLN